MGAALEALHLQRPLLFALILALLPALLVSVAARSVTDEFTIVPGKNSFQDVALDTPPTDGSTCRFRWAAVGATTELWTLTVDGDPDSQVIECVASRAGGGQTYLLFENIVMKMGHDPLDHAEMYDNDGKALLEDTDFEIKDGTVKTKQNWKGSQVREVRAVASMVG